MMQQPAMMEALTNSSRSVEDANIRSREYAKMFSRNDELKEMFGINNNPSLVQKTFSGYAETPLLSTQYFNASVASYVSSFAGFMSMSATSLISLMVCSIGLMFLGVTDMRSVIPNLGPDNLDIQAFGNFDLEITPTTSAAYSALVGRKIIPGTVRIKIKSATDSFELIDNGQGNFMSVAGKISDGTINYLNGRIEFTRNCSVGDPATESILVVGKEDTTGTPCNTVGASNAHANDKRFIAKMQQIGLATVPDLLVAEYNIAALGAMKKATGSDMATFLFTKLRELYTKLINSKLVKTLEEGYIGNTLNDLDLSATSTGIEAKFHDYRSRVDVFDSYLINVESALATKAVKGVTTTAYVAGNQASNQFQKGGMIGKFEKNTKKMTYITTARLV